VMIAPMLLNKSIFLSPVETMLLKLASS
jgi:hypothetical protein